MTSKYKGKHTGCIGDDCPICPKLDLPNWWRVRKHLVNGSTEGCRGCLGQEEWPANEPATAILLTGGIGDVIALEAMMRPEARERLETIYLACPASAQVAELFRALPNFPRLKRHEILPSPKGFHHSQAEVERLINRELPPEVEDWSIDRVFRLGLPYLGSSLLAHRVGNLPRINQPYAAIVPASSWGSWPGRSFDDSDWQTCLDWLAAHDMAGVVVSGEAGTAPAHPRLIDMGGRTSILESVEIVKAASAYLGIDSWVSVLAAKLFPANRLAVKSVWSHCYQWKEAYYAPRTDFAFLQRKLVGPG